MLLKLILFDTKIKILNKNKIIMETRKHIITMSMRLLLFLTTRFRFIFGRESIFLMDSTRSHSLTC